MMTNQTSFERFEYKYWVSDSTAQQFLQASQQYLRCDDWALGGQRNTSLYLDTPQRGLARLHMEAAPDRFKLRVRTYGEPPSGNAFFEIKRKVKAVTLKRRAVVPLAAVSQLLSGYLPAELKLNSAEEEQTLSEFLYLMLAHRVEPALLITARREAFTSIDHDDGVRLTLDREMCFQPAQGSSLQGSPHAWTHLCGMGHYAAEASTLIELKFRGQAPFWVPNLAERMGLQRSNFSKYIAAVQYEAFGPEGLVQLERTPSWGLSPRGVL